MSKKFVIYLDIDGVLVPYGEKKFKPEAVEALNQIIGYYKADLVMISAWNKLFQNAFEYATCLQENGLVFESLSIGMDSQRACFVAMRQDKNPNYLIIDDETEQYHKQYEIDYNRILQPNGYRCLDECDVKQVTLKYKLNTNL